MQSNHFKISHWNQMMLLALRPLFFLFIILMMPVSFASPDQLTYLSQVLTELGIPHEKNAKSIKDTFQVFRRKPGVERWQVKDLEISKVKREKILNLLTEAGFIQELKPASKKFDYIFLMGASTKLLKRRMDMLESLVNAGIDFNELVVLTCQRPMDTAFDDVLSVRKAFAKKKNIPVESAPIPNTETEAGAMLVASSNLPIEKIKVTVIDSRRILHDVQWYRPNSQITISDWLKTKPKPGKVLVISNQPHANYQLSVAKSNLPSNFDLEVAAMNMTDGLKLITTLDAVALCVYECPRV